MREDRALYFTLWGFVSGAAIACSLIGSTATPTVPTVGISTAVSPTATSASATEVPPTSTPEATSIPPIGGPTAIPPTPVQGPAIAHLAVGQAFDVGYIRMVDAQKGWSIGGLSQAEDHVFRTENGGQAWKDVTPPEPAPAAGTAIAATGYFADASHGWVVYAPTQMGAVPPGVRVWFTGDGGISWSYGVVDTSAVSQESFLPLFLDFADSQHGWLLVVLGGGMNHQYAALFSTLDGGKTWSDIQDPTTPAEIQSFPKTGMTFANSQTGWLTRDAQGVDQSPHVIQTTDGGSTWTRIELPAPAGSPAWFDSYACGTYAPVAPSAQSLLVLMKCEDSATFKVEHDFLYSTSDAGQTWKSVALPADFTVADPPAGGLYFTSASTGLALGRRIYRTDDGGKTWSIAKQVNWDGQFSFVDLGTGWAVARDAGQIALVNTIDGGATWKEIHPVVGP